MDRADVERDLDEFVEGDVWPEPQEDGEPTPLPDPTAVSGVLRRLKRLAADAALIQQVAADDVARINAFTEDRLSGIESQRRWGERSLENFMRIFGPSAKKRSLKLSDGTLKLTKPSERVVVTDEKAFLEWAGVKHAEPEVEGGDVPPPDVSNITQPDFVRVKPEINKSALKSLDRGPNSIDREAGTVTAPLLLPGGEMIPGVVIEHDIDDKFGITLGED